MTPLDGFMFGVGFAVAVLLIAVIVAVAFALVGALLPDKWKRIL